MDLKLLSNLVLGIFSLDPTNMRWFNTRRVLVVLVVVPIFITLLVINRIFLLLDYLIFPFFTKQEIKQPVFIIATPRSGTTYLYHLLANNERYTSFKLWEIVLAPSIIQKYFFIGIIKLDHLFNSPIRKLTLSIENFLIGDLKKVHLIGLSLPEEDEAVLIWDLSSIYLNFFYPDSNFFDKYLLFDKELSAKRKRKIMSSYLNYLKRHNFVFNRNGHKQFLSKNPLMMSKVASLHSIFPDALILNINRCPQQVIPSTINLNHTLYKIFTSIPANKDLDQRTVSVLIDWYQMANKNLDTLFKNQVLHIHFGRFVANNESEIKSICQFLAIDESVFPSKGEKAKSDKKHKSKKLYVKLSDKESAVISDALPFMNKYCN